MSRNPRYLVVTPARDEAATIGALAEALLAQTVPLSKWVVVDDGSSDGTAGIVRSIAEHDDRVTLIQRPDRRDRSTGLGGIAATMAGLRTVSGLFEYDFVANIDADVAIDKDYFERLFARFDEDPRLGLAGGYCYTLTDNGPVLDKSPDEHVHGATKIYRGACLSDIWPLAEVWGWDAVDEGRAQIRGWRTRSFPEPHILHAKPMSGGTGRVLRGKFVFGRTCHFLGYRPDFALLRAAMNAGRPPYLIGGLAMALGYATGPLSKTGRIDDPEFVEHLRASQSSRMRSAVRAGMSRIAGAR